MSNVAIDLDGTLADIHTPAIERADGISAYRPDSFDSEDWKEYKHRSQNVWHNHSDEIQLVENCAPEVVAAVAAEHHVTILTHRRNVDEQIQEWLAAQGIEYDDFIATHRDKATFDMDVYVDDNRIDAPSASVFLRHQPWNIDLESGFDTRIESLKQLLPALEITL